ncbi:CTP synthase [Bienertia sinuspersici]
MASYHTRSFSFPAKSHPVVDQLSEQLNRLRSSQSASTSSTTSKLNDLKDLYKSVDEFLHLPQNQKIVSVEEVIDGSLRLLDICSTSQDVLVQSKKQIQDLQSVLRRRCNSDLNISNDFALYLQSRKSAKKTIKKSLKNIKEAVGKANESNVIDSMLKDVQAITADVFKSLLTYISGSQKSSWSFSKLVGQKTEKQTPASISKFEDVDATIESICQKKKSNIDMSEIVQLESEVQEIDEVVECLFRHLVKTRVTLLNVLSN